MRAAKMRLAALLHVLGSSLRAASYDEATTCRATVDGLCVGDVFHAYDRMLAPAWPGTVDLIVRMFAGRGYTVQPFLRSVELFWPHNVGDVIAVLDEGEEYLREMLPPWVRVEYEGDPHRAGDLYPQRKGWLLKEYSDFFLDRYTSADYVAIADTDMVLSTKVTPDLLFEPQQPGVGGHSSSSGGDKLILIGRNSSAINQWCGGVDFFLGPSGGEQSEMGVTSSVSGGVTGEGGGNGEAKDAAEVPCVNFMAALPWVVPRAMFAPLRQHVLRQHGLLHVVSGASGAGGHGHDSGSSSSSIHGGSSSNAHSVEEEVALRQVFAAWAETEKPNECATFSIMGNYMLRYERERHEFRVEGGATAPGLRYGVHAAYSARLVDLVQESGALDRPGYDKKLSTELLVASARSVHEGACHAFPAGALPGCEGLGVGEEMFRDLILWEKARHSYWKRNRGAPQGSPSARDLYWAYYTRLWGLYGRLLQERGLIPPAGAARGDAVAGDADAGDGGGGEAPAGIDGQQHQQQEGVAAAEERRRDI